MSNNLTTGNKLGNISLLMVMELKCINWEPGRECKEAKPQFQKIPTYHLTSSWRA